MIAAPTAEQIEQTLNIGEEYEEITQKADMPLPLRIVRRLALAFGCITTSPVLSNVLSGKLTFSEQLRIAPILTILGPIALIVGLILLWISKRKAKTVTKSPEVQECAAAVDDAVDKIFAELGIPEDAAEIDVLAFFYKEKDGEIKVCEKPMQLFSHVATAFKIFSDADNLYLANLNGKYAFPRAELQGIRRVDQKVRITNWSKSVKPTQGEYKSFKMTVDQFGSVHAKPHYILELMHEGEKWGIYFPCYELTAVESTTGLSAQ